MKTRLFALGVAVVIAWALKRHYADARPDDLWWILGPTARLVGTMTGAAFVAAPGEGYVSREHLFLIEKSCAGINFMIGAFGMLACALCHRVESARSTMRVMTASVLASYAAAVIVNAVRITIAMWLTTHHVFRSALSPADVHRVEGITVYFTGLVVVYELAQWFDRSVVPVRRRP